MDTTNMEETIADNENQGKDEIVEGNQPQNLSLIRSGSRTPNQEENLSVDHQSNGVDRDESGAKDLKEVKKRQPWRSPCSISDCLTFSSYTLFPCCFLGNITSEFERETKCSCMLNNFCQDCAMGSKGCINCLCMSVLAFPCSPCLSCYLLRERWKLKLFYPYDDRLRPLTSIFDYCYYGCCWMKNLQEQHTFIHTLQREGNLTFAWDYALYRDYLPKYRNLTPPSSSSSSVSTFMNSSTTILPARLPYDNPTLLVFGPNTLLKQQFLRKLLMQTNNKELTDINKQYPILQETHHIQTGVRSILTEDQELKFLEVWDIPMNHFYSSFIPRLQDETFVSLYLFDLNDAINFQEMKKIFAYYEFLSHKPRIIIVLKDNPMNMLVPATITVPTPPTQSLANASFTKLKNATNNTNNNNNNHSIYTSHNSSSEALLVNQSVDKVALEAEILTWARRQGVLWYHISVFDEMNYLVLNKQIVKLIPKRPQL